MLNARPENVRKEAQIVAQAGLPSAVTIATNMAGRGTDIVLGGNPRGLALQILLRIYGTRLLTGKSRLRCSAPALTSRTLDLTNRVGYLSVITILSQHTYSSDT